jgi:hypothetical protein
MNKIAGRFIASVVIGLVLIMPLAVAFADTDSERRESEASESFRKLSAEWWQWALSLPTSVNPQLDTTGGRNAVVGQRGSTWFLAGVFGGGTATRTCSVPQGTALFFPVINSVQINSPNVGQGPEDKSAKELRSAAALFINEASNLSVTVDGIEVKRLRRVKSEVFVVVLPEENIFEAPPGIYSPAVDDGVYVMLDPLRVGNHTLHFHAENLSVKPVFIQDVTYNLTVVTVLEK